MNSDLRALLLMLVVFWGAWWLFAIVARRSYIPVIPLYPLTLAAAGYLLNKVCSWAGTCVVAGIHLLLVSRMIRDASRRPSRNNGRPPT